MAKKIKLYLNELKKSTLLQIYHAAYILLVLHILNYNHIILYSSAK